MMQNSRTLSIEAALHQAIASHRAGQIAAASALYERVIAVEPAHAEANHNLGVIFVQAGRVEEGLTHLRQALMADNRVPLYFLSYARGLLAARQLDEAEAALFQGMEGGLADKRFAVLFDSIGGEILERGDVEGAIRLFRKALITDPDFADAHYHLGSALSESGRIAEGFEHYMRRAALVYGTGKGPPAKQPDPLHKVKHDIGQRDYLAGGEAPPSAPAVHDMFVLSEGARVKGPAINPANDRDRILAAWRDSHPQLVVIDDFLTTTALQRLRDYCAGSTVWRKNYAAGYLGAAPEDGFACPLLAQIVEEIQTEYALIIAGEPFRYLGAFKYDSELSTGTNTHADNSAINVNFYITPDEANLDPDHGGMIIWDLAAPDVEAQRRYSSSETEMADLLARSGAKPTIVPHRSNRAIIFKSALFHKTDAFTFRPDYLSRRINVSLLFGQLG